MPAMMTKTTLTALCTTLVLAVAPVDAQKDPLLVGEFAVKKVFDGDTILVEGLQRSIREWAMRQGWGGRPVRIEQAQGILVAALGVLAAYYGYGRR